MKPSDRFLLLANRKKCFCCCGTVCLIFPSSYICFITSVDTVFKNVSRNHNSLPPPPKKKRISQCNIRVCETLLDKEISICCNNRLIGIFKKVYKINTILISKHYSLKYSSFVNLPMDIVGTIILTLQHYPMFCARGKARIAASF